MPKKVNKKSPKSPKKSLLGQVETRLTESLMDLPRKISEKKFRKTIQKAGKILTRSLATKPVKVTSKNGLKKSKKKKLDIKQEIKVQAVQ